MRHFLFICSFFLISVATQAQANDLPDPKPYFSAIIVSDLDSSMDWYAKNFGLEVVNKVEMADRGFSQANMKRGGTWIELIQLGSALSQKELLSNQPPKTKIEGYFKFGFTVASFDQWVEFLTKSEVDLYGSVVEDPNSGKRMIIALDPDGNRIQLFEE